MKKVEIHQDNDQNCTIILWEMIGSTWQFVSAKHRLSAVEAAEAARRWIEYGIKFSLVDTGRRL